MAVGLRRPRPNPYAPQSPLGYGGQEIIPFIGQEDIPVPLGVGEVGPETQSPPQLIKPIEANESDFLSRAVGVSGGQQEEAQDYPSESAIARQLKMAQAMREQGAQGGEVQHPLQALGYATKQIVGSWQENKAAKQQEELEKRRRDALKGALGQGGDLNALADNLMNSPDPALVERGLELKLKLATAGRKANKPDFQDFIEGDTVVQKQFDEETGEWKEVGRGPRWKRGFDGDGGGGGNGTIAPTSQGGTFSLPDGRIVSAPFVKGRGFVYRDEDGSYKDIPHDARPVTNSAGGPMNANQWLKLKQDRNEGRNALVALDQYMKSVGGLPQGVKRWANDLSAKFKTFIGRSNLTPDEFNQLDAWQKQQALIGLFRTTVVGPGVVTEYDAVRIIQALGGDPSSALQNPQVLEKVLNDLYGRKKAEVEILDREYQRNAPFFNEQAEPLGVPDRIGPDRGGQQQSQAKPPADGDRKTINGKTYIRKGGRWYPEQ